MGLDAVIISSPGQESLSSANNRRLKLDGTPGTIQAISNYLEHDGRIVPPIKQDGVLSWWSAPRLNGIFLLSYLIKQNLKVELITKYYEERDAFHRFLKHNPRAIIISTTFIHTKKTLCKLVEDIRSLAPDVFIIAGGPFVYNSYHVRMRSNKRDFVTAEAREDFLFFDKDEPSVDLFIISRGGEQILSEALTRLKKRGTVDDFPNTAKPFGGYYCFADQMDDISNNGEVFLDWRSLPDTIFESGVLPLQASGGCPHECAFCTFKKDRKMIFKKTIDEIIEELKTVSSRGVRYVRFVDDNFRLGSPEVNFFCRRMIDEELDIHWMSMFTANTLKNVDAELLRRAGCVEVALGIESADRQVLENMNKKADPSTYPDVIRKILSAGINCSCYILFGFPGETDESAKRTLELLKSVEHPELEGLLSWELYTFTLTPLSPVYEYEMREKYRLTGYRRNWKHATMDSNRAREHVKKAFHELNNSCPIYRGDNLDMLLSLPPYQRKAFFIRRHQLGKMALEKPVPSDDVVRSFADILKP